MNENVERVPCPYCRELIMPGAVKCKECGSNLGRLQRTKPLMEWIRNLPDRKFFGVCSMIAKNFHVSVTLVRLIFVLLAFLQLVGVLIYFVLVAIVPYDHNKRSLFETVVDAISAALESVRTRPVVASGPSPAHESMPPLSPDSSPIENRTSTSDNSTQTF